MPWFNVELDNELAKEFKLAVIRKYEVYRGNVNKGFAEAVNAWVRSELEMEAKK